MPAGVLWKYLEQLTWLPDYVGDDDVAYGMAELPQQVLSTVKGWDECHHLHKLL